MKKLMQVFASVMIATSTFGGVTSVAAKENTPAYKIEYQNADSMQSVFTKELHQKYANVKFKKKSKNVSVYESKNYKVKVKDLDIDTIRTFGEFDVKKGDVNDVFQVDVSPDVSLIGTVNHDGMLRGITYIVVPSGDSQKAMMDTLILVGITSNIISGEENKSKTSKVVTDLLTKALDGIDKEKNSHNAVVGNVKYFATASKLTGLWFGVEPVNAD